MWAPLYTCHVVAKLILIFTLISPDTFGCSEEVVTIAAMLQVHHAFNQSIRQKVALVSSLVATCSVISRGVDAGES